MTRSVILTKRPMDIQDSWEKALKQTEIIRPRIQPLLTFETTHLPYIFLAESLPNVGDTVVRKGEILVERPSLILPSHFPQFEGFEFEKELHTHEHTVTNFLLLRGVRFPSLRYNNKISSLEVYEDKLTKAVEHYSHQLQKAENVTTGLLIGPEDAWQFSVLIFIGIQVMRSAERDIQKLFEELRKKGKLP